MRRGWAALAAVLLAASVQAAPPAVTSADGRWRSVWRDGREILEVPDRQGGPVLRIDPRAARLLESP